MAIKKQPTPPKQKVTIKKKVNADSLMSESRRKKSWANQQEGIAKYQIKKDGGNKPYVSTSMGNVFGGVEIKKGPSGNERMSSVAKLRESASKDSVAAVKAKPSLTPKPAVKKKK